VLSCRYELDNASKGNSKVVLVHAIKVCEDGGVTTLILTTALDGGET
jgi:hypothetical protein